LVHRFLPEGILQQKLQSANRRDNCCIDKGEGLAATTNRSSDLKNAACEERASGIDEHVGLSRLGRRARDRLDQRVDARPRPEPERLLYLSAVRANENPRDLDGLAFVEAELMARRDAELDLSWVVRPRLDAAKAEPLRPSTAQQLDLERPVENLRRHGEAEHTRLAHQTRADKARGASA
jgi:hypothetical protein